MIVCACQVIEQRTGIIEQIEAAAEELKSNGEREGWLASADPLVREVSKDVNGPLLEMLAEAINFHDCECIELFRKGCPLASLLSCHFCFALAHVTNAQVGVLPCSGNGTPVTAAAASSCDELRAQRLTNNLKVLERLREDEHAQSLFATCVADAAKGRMTPPSVATAQVLSDFTVSPRFGVHQGGKDILSLRFPF